MGSARVSTWQISLNGARRGSLLLASCATSEEAIRRTCACHPSLWMISQRYSPPLMVRLVRTRPLALMTRRFADTISFPTIPLRCCRCALATFGQVATILSGRNFISITCIQPQLLPQVRLRTPEGKHEEALELQHHKEWCQPLPTSPRVVPESIVAYNIMRIRLFWGTLQGEGTASTTPPINGNAKSVVSVDIKTVSEDALF